VHYSKDPTRDNCFTRRAVDTHRVMAGGGLPSTSCSSQQGKTWMPNCVGMTRERIATPSADSVVQARVLSDAT
jgi:hypothetical protein